MGSRNAGLAAGALVGLAGLAIACSTPAAAQSINRNLIRELNTQLLYVALPLAVFVEVILIYAVIRFRDNPDPLPTIDSPNLEVTWTVATGIILLFVGISAYVVLGTPYISPDAYSAQTGAATSDGNAERIYGLGYQFDWEFRYPDANVTTRGLLVMPAERNVSIRLSSADVIHSLFVPRLGIKKDAFPGRYTEVRTYVYERGTYRGYCAELCGPGHSLMRTEVIVVSQSAYQDWLANNTGRRNVTAPPTPA